MAYYYEKMSYLKGEWFAHLLIPSKIELNDSLEYITGKQRTAQNLSLLLTGAKNQPPSPPDYGVVTSRHQIDKNGSLFVSNAWNIRQQTTPTSTFNAALDTEAVRYATQYDFDKFCFDNPGVKSGFDWNAEVFRAFSSSTPGVYTPASNNDDP